VSTVIFGFVRGFDHTTVVPPRRGQSVMLSELSFCFSFLFFRMRFVSSLLRKTWLHWSSRCSQCFVTEFASSFVKSPVSWNAMMRIFPLNMPRKRLIHLVRASGPLRFMLRVMRTVFAFFWWISTYSFFFVMWGFFAVFFDSINLGMVSLCSGAFCRLCVKLSSAFDFSFFGSGVFTIFGFSAVLFGFDSSKMLIRGCDVLLFPFRACIALCERDQWMSLDF